MRIFQEHRIRPVASLDGLWRLKTERGAFDAWVPGVWERIPALAGYRGAGVYSRAVEIPEDGNYLLKFGGVSHTADVCWDGAPVAHHYNAFTGFEVLLAGVKAGAHALTVRADNGYGPESTLHIPNDYYNYGGVTRPVELHRVGGAYIERMAFHSTEADGAFTAHVKVWVRAIDTLNDARVAVRVADGRACVPASAGAGETVCLEVEIPVRDVKRWDVGEGNLYDLSCVLLENGAAVDDLVDRVGFRTVAVRGEDILLNGKKIFLKGFDRHEDHGLFGCALSVEAMADDLQLALDMGANSIRTSHYPNDPRFLDLCDQLGILVWEEHHARAIPREILETETFARQISDCNIEMIAQHVNHPCIYVWGVLNECESESEFGRALYAKNLNQLRALDPTRPVTFASCRFFTDICLDLPDIASFNIYPRWYVDEPVEDYTEKLLQWMDASGAAGKPIIISEVGAGAVAGYRDPFGMAKWSEERQAAILEEQLTALLANPRLSGAYIWQFADVRVDEEWAMRRPKTVNNKGVVDMFRRPKLAYATVRRIFRGKK